MATKARRQVYIVLQMDIPDGQELPTSEEISEELDHYFREPESDGAWRFNGYDIWLSDIKDYDPKSGKEERRTDPFAGN